MFQGGIERISRCQTEEIPIGAFAALLVVSLKSMMWLSQFNFSGDTLSDLVSELSGSLGLAGSINTNAEMVAVWLRLSMGLHQI